MTKFRTASGSLYILEGATLTRLSERPVPGYPVVPVEVELLGQIEVGAPAVFWAADGRLRTTTVVEVMA